MSIAPTTPRGIRWLKGLATLIVFLRACTLGFGIAFIASAFQAWSYYTFRQLHAMDDLTIFIVGSISTFSTLLLTLHNIISRVRLSKRLSASRPHNSPNCSPAKPPRKCSLTRPLILRTAGELANLGLWMATGVLWTLSDQASYTIGTAVYRIVDNHVTGWEYVLFGNAGAFALTDWFLSLGIMLLVIWEEIWVWRVQNKATLNTIDTTLTNNSTGSRTDSHSNTTITMAQHQDEEAAYEHEDAYDYANVSPPRGCEAFKSFDVKAKDAPTCSYSKAIVQTDEYEDAKSIGSMSSAGEEALPPYEENSKGDFVTALEKNG